MKFTSSLATAVSGAIGNMVGLMNRSGMCLRARVVPSNPNTAAQQGVRNTLATLAAAWSGTLTAAQRAAWNAYAATLSFTNKIGVPYTITGFDAYVMGNGARMVAGLSRVDPGPVVAGFAGFTSPTLTFNDTANTVSVAFTNTDDWAGEVGGALIGRICPIGFPPGVGFYEGPFIYLNKILGAVSPPSSPATWAVAAGIDAGVQYAVALRAVRADGRCSQERIFRGLGV